MKNRNKVLVILIVGLIIGLSSCSVKKGYYDFAGAFVSPPIVHVDEDVEIMIQGTEVTDWDAKRKSYLTFEEDGEYIKVDCEDNLNTFKVKFTKEGWHRITFHAEYENSGYVESDYSFMIYVHEMESY